MSYEKKPWGKTSKYSPPRTMLARFDGRCKGWCDHSKISRGETIRFLGTGSGVMHLACWEKAQNRVARATTILAPAQSHWKQPFQPFSMRSKYNSRCQSCSEPISRGDWIQYLGKGKGAEHLDCVQKKKLERAEFWAKEHATKGPRTTSAIEELAAMSEVVFG